MTPTAVDLPWVLVGTPAVTGVHVLTGLTDNHARSLLASIQYAAKLLRECDDALDASAGREVLPRYSGTVPAPTAKITRDYLDRLREQLRRTMAAIDLHPPSPNRSALHSISTTLLFLDNTFEEMRSGHLRGYGDVSGDAGGVLDGVVTELQELVRDFEAFLTGGSNEQAQARLDRYPSGNSLGDTLREASMLIATHGLVDLRPALTLLIDRAMENSFEIGVIGRVSSGKSSLLNALIGAPVLPTGILPLTAFPTRVRRGPRERLEVTFANGNSETFPLDRIADFVTEEHNPGNTKRLLRIAVESPGGQLPEGVTFVDTPGLGSVASRGALQTLAYLPRCDHAAFLFDATAPITEDDLEVMAYLRDAGTGTSVLISKADLLSPEDVARVRSYVAAQIRQRLGAEVTVRTISVARNDGQISDWLTDEIAPLAASARVDASAGILQKALALRARVNAVIDGGTPRLLPRDATERSMRFLREVSARLEQQHRKLLGLPEQHVALVDLAVDGAADYVANSHGLPNEEALRAALLRPSQSLGSMVAEELNACARDIRSGLADAASALGVEHLVLDATLAQETPTMDLPPMAGVDLRPPMWARGGRLARKWAHQQISKQLGQAIDAAVSAYLDVLKRWAIESLANLRREYESHSRALQLGATKG